MELVKIILGIISVGVLSYLFYCLCKTKQTLEIMANTIEAMTDEMKELGDDYHGHEHD